VGLVSVVLCQSVYGRSCVYVDKGKTRGKWACDHCGTFQRISSNFMIRQVIVQDYRAAGRLGP
jgi:hypothetical protein